ncbi:MAG: helix-turn-helix domain-containing protein [Clostridiaceae bacterium]
MEFKDRLFYLRKKNEMTQQELASKLGFESYTPVNLWEAGKRKPSSDVLIQLADLFNVTTDYLLGRADNEYRLVIEDIGDRNMTLIEIDNNIYPHGWTHDKVLNMIDKLEKLGIRID